MTYPPVPPAFAHCATLAAEYRELVTHMHTAPMLTGEERHTLSSERTVLHDALIAEFARLGYPVADRAEARQRAFQFAAWLRDSATDSSVAPTSGEPA